MEYWSNGLMVWRRIPNVQDGLMEYWNIGLMVKWLNG